MSRPNASEANDIFQDMSASGGRPSELTPSQTRYLRAYLEDSLFAFCQLVMGYGDLDPLLHGELSTYIESLGSDGRKRLMSQIPRGHLKSSVGTIAHAAWAILRHPDEPIAIINQNESNTSNWLRAIRDVFERSDWVHALWPELLPRGVYHGDSRSRAHSLKWSDSELELEGRRMGEPEASISGYGRGSGHTGHHWRRLIIDDIIGPKERDSQAEMAQANGFILAHTALMRPAEGGLSYVNCTPWTFSDVYTTMIKSYGYALYRRSALEKDGLPTLSGSPIFPKMFDRETLLALYKANRSSFLAQYMCSPIPGEETSFKETSLRYFRVHRNDENEPTTLEIEPSSYRPRQSQTSEEIGPRFVKLSQLNIVAFLDPAPSEPSEKRSEPLARNGLAVLGIDAWGRKFLLVGKGSRDGALEVIHWLFREARRWGFNRIGIEEVNFSKLYRPWIQSLQTAGQIFENQHLTPVPLEPGRTNKNIRIENKANGFDNGDYYINRSETEDFYEEYTQYPYGATRDILDALAYDDRLLFRPATDEEEQAMIFSRLHRTADRVTGY